MMEDLLQVGAIASTHGVRGEVKIYSMTDDVNRFRELKEVYLDTGKEMKLLHIQSCKFFKNQPILKFEEFNNINDIEGYKRCGLYVNRENAIQLAPNEFFVADMIGATVYEENEKVLGTLIDVLETGANDVYVVKRENGKEVLLPAIKDCIKSFNIEEKRMDVVVMKGLLDE